MVWSSEEVEEKKEKNKLKSEFLFKVKNKRKTK